MRTANLLICTVFIAFRLFFSGGFTEETGFDTSESTLNLTEYVESIDLSFFGEEPNSTSACCFDVNDSGMYALGMEGRKDMILVFNSDGNFAYGYSFDVPGLFDVELGNTGIIFLSTVRGDIVLTLDAKGNALSIRSICDTKENREFRRNVLDSRVRIANNSTYTLKNEGTILNYVGSSWSILVRTDAYGNSETLYDVSTAHNTRAILVACVYAFAFIGVPVYIIWSHVNRKKKRTEA